MNPYRSLIDIGIKLTSEQNLDRLLNLILQNARAICNVDAGTLYLKEGECLRFSVSQNTSLESKMGKEKFQNLFIPFTLPISNQSIAGWCAKNLETLNIEDAYKIKDVPYSHNSKFDEETGYRTKSMLTIPIKDKDGRLLGVLQLINKRGDQGKKVFTRQDEKVAEAVASQAAVAIKNAKLTEELKSAHLETIYKLGLAAESKDEGTGNHVKRVSEISRIIAEGLGLDDDFIETIYYASPLHDVGKIGIPDSILTKPGHLTEEEQKIMKSHTVLGYQILKDSKSKIIQTAAEIAYSHHERWDGTGYPSGLAGEEIPLSGRIVALADFFDAVTSSRPYREGIFTMAQTLKIIKEETCKHFSPKVTAAFFSSLDRIKKVHYLLSNGEII
jgi:HD-GYP domain-containing protein (c-di-GMP phosphodiesterase class II)